MPDDLPLTREQQIKFMEGAADRRDALLERWMQDEELKEILRRTPEFETKKETK